MFNEGEDASLVITLCVREQFHKHGSDSGKKINPKDLATVSHELSDAWWDLHASAFGLSLGIFGSRAGRDAPWKILASLVSLTWVCRFGHIFICIIRSRNRTVASCARPWWDLGLARKVETWAIPSEVLRCRHAAGKKAALIAYQLYK